MVLDSVTSTLVVAAAGTVLMVLEETSEVEVLVPFRVTGEVAKRVLVVSGMVPSALEVSEKMLAVALAGMVLIMVLCVLLSSKRVLTASGKPVVASGMTERVLVVSGMAGWVVVVMSRVAEKVFVASKITGRGLVGSGLLIASGVVEMMLVVSGMAGRVVVSVVAERVLVA